MLNDGRAADAVPPLVQLGDPNPVTDLKAYYTAVWTPRPHPCCRGPAPRHELRTGTRTGLSPLCGDVGRRRTGPQNVRRKQKNGQIPTAVHWHPDRRGHDRTRQCPPGPPRSPLQPERAAGDAGLLEPLPSSSPLDAGHAPREAPAALPRSECHLAELRFHPRPLLLPPVW